MKSLYVKFFMAVMLAVFVAVFFSSCRERQEIDAGQAMVSRERTITIVNETGQVISGWRVYAAGSGVFINDGTLENNRQRVTLIAGNFVSVPQFEVVLEDRYGRTFASIFDVPTTGNTVATIAFSDRVEEGLIRDRWRDLNAWFNR
ncbi:MAG: hypothetical protein FWG66_11440 [Spirochaetes bacterium]|nr:hypothetical protein [Spirochaetota bacterium]